MTGATFRTGYQCQAWACMDLPLKKVDTSTLCLMHIRPSTVKTVGVKSVLRISRSVTESVRSVSVPPKVLKIK